MDKNIRMNKIKDIHRIAEEINDLSHFYQNLSLKVKLEFISKLSGKIILICEDLEDSKEKEKNLSYQN